MMKRIQMFIGLILFFITAVSCSEEATNTLSEGNVQGTETKKVSSEQKVASNQSSTTSSSSIDLEQAVGYINEDGNAILTLDKDKLMQAYTSYLKKQSRFDVDFSSVDLIEYKDKQKAYYNLKFLTTTESKYTILVEYVEGYLIMYGLSCVTPDCSQDSGCEAVSDVDGKRCSSCSGKCTKTTTLGNFVLHEFKEFYPKLYEDNIEFLKKVKVYKG